MVLMPSRPADDFGHDVLRQSVNTVNKGTFEEKTNSCSLLIVLVAVANSFTSVLFLPAQVTSYYSNTFLPEEIQVLEFVTVPGSQCDIIITNLA